MIKKINQLFLFSLLISSFYFKEEHTFELKDENLFDEFELVAGNENPSQEYSVQFDDLQKIKDNIFYISLESQNSSIVLEILQEDQKAKESLYKMGTYSGNLLFLMSETFHKNKLDFIKQQGKLMFRVTDQQRQGYKLKVGINSSIDLPAGKIYSTRLDTTIKKLNVNFKYDGTQYNDLQKLRFQATSIRQKKNYSMNVQLQYKDNIYRMNPIFKKSVGGILSKPFLPVCQESECIYTMSMDLKNIKSMNIESFLISKIEQISINHYEEYYDKVYQPNQLTIYELPYVEEMEGLDISINLIPVTGETGLYINAKSLPQNLEEYDWKQTGKYAKRITIKWSELVLMKAEKTNLFICVQTKNPGEFLIEVDAHDSGFVGKLHSGIIEQGYIEANGFINYLYYFSVYQTQKINFDVKLNIMSGQADLYLKQCNSYLDCKLDSAQINNQGVIKLENMQNPKILENEFTCEYQEGQLVSVCQFVIGVKGSQSTDSHYEISVQESSFNRLMVPGSVVNLQMDPNDVIYYKFSYPTQQKNNKLYLQVEALWGQFQVTVSKFDQKPKESNRNFTQYFAPQNLGINDSMTITEMNKSTIHDNPIGIYYIAVKATTNSSLNMQFYEKGEETTNQLHSLHMNQQQRGLLSKKSEIIYYITKIASQNADSQKIKIIVTPLKGKFIIMANKNSNTFPTIERHDLMSESSILEIEPDQMYKESEYIIGIQLSPDVSNEDDNYQFYISMNQNTLPQKIYPGVVSQQTIGEINNYYAEITSDMDDILIMKSIVDGYNIQMCVDFIQDNISNYQVNKCTYKAEDKKVSLEFKKDLVLQHCNFTKNQDTDCFMVISITGNLNQKFSLGYTYNQLPFILVKDLIVTGPMPLSSSQQLHFIYHGEHNKPIGLYFNTKGFDLNIYTKISQDNQRGNKYEFPSPSDYDQDVQQKRGYITNIQYNNEKMAQYGQQPELLITIEGKQNNGRIGFDHNHNFILVTSMDPHEILRTQVYTEQVLEDQWNYYNFYNNGNSENVRVYVSTPASPRLEVVISKGIQSRPPFTNKPILSKMGIGSLDLELTKKDLQQYNSQDSDLKGYYTIGVRTSTTCEISMYWNNKNDLNFAEITPNEPTTMQLEHERELYVSFYAKKTEQEKNGSIYIYFKTNVKSEIYILKSDGELIAPNENDYHWSTSTSIIGGVTMIEIQPTDPNYCMDCIYIAYIKSEYDGQVTLLANIRQEGMPIMLTPGFTFQDSLKPQEKNIYRLHNIDGEQIGVSVTMISGLINLYISDQENVNEVNHKEKYEMQKSLDIHKYISIHPKSFNIQSEHDYYIMTQNKRNEKAQYTLTIQKNGLNIPIEPGISKYVILASQEKTEYIYTPKSNEALFELRLELEQVIDNKKIIEAKQKLSQFIKLYHINENNEKFLIKFNNKSISKNKIYIEFDISKNQNGSFAIEVTNPVSCPVALTLDLLNGNYKLINLNDYELDSIRGHQIKHYESFGQLNKNLFINLKICSGNVNIKLFQGTYNKHEEVQYTKLIDNNSSTYYFKQTQERFFFDISSADNKPALYEINVFNEKDIENNEYTRIESGNEGRVFVDLEKNKAQFKPIYINSTYNKEFYHKVTYQLFISDDSNVTQYAKNCGDYMIQQFFKDPHIIKNSQSILFNGPEQIQNYKQNKIELSISNLKPGTRYYCQVIARVELFPQGTGYLTPVKTGKLYYDQFVFVTPKIRIPMNMLVSVLIALTFFVTLTCIIKAIVFGKINKLMEFDKIDTKEEYEKNVYGTDFSDILEKDYYEDEQEEKKPEQKDAQQSSDADTNQKEDKNKKTEIEMQEAENRSKPLDV